MFYIILYLTNLFDARQTGGRRVRVGRISPHRRCRCDRRRNSYVCGPIGGRATSGATSGAESWPLAARLQRPDHH